MPAIIKRMGSLGVGTAVLFALLWGMFIIPEAQAATVINGDITTDTVWTVDGSPYQLTGDVTVHEGVTLTIESGVVVEVAENARVDVYGFLEVSGTAQAPVTFTSVSGGAADRWSGLLIWESAKINHARVEFARSGIQHYNLNQGMQVQNTEFVGNGNTPLMVQANSYHLAVLENLTFTNNVKNYITINYSTNNHFQDDVTLKNFAGLDFYWSQFEIPQGVTMTVEAGVQLWGIISVNGLLKTRGTAAEPVLLDGSTLLSQLTEIKVVKGSLDLDHTVIRNYPLGMSVYIPTGPVSIKNSQIISMGNLLWVELDALHLLQLENVTFEAGDHSFIYVNNYSIRLLHDTMLVSQPGLAGYIFLDELLIPAGVTLAIEPGLKVQMAENHSNIIVEGQLKAMGTASEPITFGPAASNSSLRWGGLTIKGHGTADLQHTQILSAFVGIYAMSGDQISLVHSEIHGADIVAQLNGGQIDIRCSQISDNQAGIWLPEGSVATLKIFSTNLFNHNVTLVNENNETVVQATHNWWGDVAGPGSGGAISGAITYEPWLTAPANCLPEVVAGEDMITTAGSSLTFSGRYTDSNETAPPQIQWSFGDGSTATTLTATHSYAMPGLYTAALTITDTDGEVGQDNLLVTVVSTATGRVSIALENPPPQILPHTPLTFSGRYTDSNPHTPPDIQWSFGDGATITGTLTPTHQYAAGGSYTVTLTISDTADGVFLLETFEVTVANGANQAPQATLDPLPTEIWVNTPFTFTGRYTDSDETEPPQILWSFGDGETATDTLTVTHTYTHSGVYTISLTITDSLGGQSQATRPLLVSNYVVYLPAIISVVD